ncbi:MAG: hypothetical protein J5819_10475 [Eubacterium sp.]|nr:hypothetical protein [Eubacterium sp.]
MKQRVLKRVAAVVLGLTVAFASPCVAFAAESSASNMQELAKAVAQQGMNRVSDFVVHYTGPDSDIDKLMDDNDLEFFYSTMAIEDDPSTSDDADYLIGTIDYSKDFDYSADANNNINFKLRYFETLDQTKFVNERIPQILAELGVAGMTNYQKVKTIHDYVCNLITYKSNDEDIVSTVYGALTTHETLCNSYSLTMYKLLVGAGIPCKYIGGAAGTGRDADGHAWNLVALGDHWYNLDATWDDGGADGINYDYFLKGSSDFDAADPSQKHKMDPPYNRNPYKSTFPIAVSAFNPELMSDVNTLITIGGTNPGSAEEDKLAFDDVVYGLYPENGKFTVKRNKKMDLQVELQKAAGTMVESFDYKVLKGKSCIKKIKNYGVQNDEGVFFTDLEFTGKKKGKVSIEITLNLINGQKMSVTFSGKVK